MCARAPRAGASRPVVGSVGGGQIGSEPQLKTLEDRARSLDERFARDEPRTSLDLGVGEIGIDLLELDHEQACRLRRFTRLTSAFSKKLENHAAAIARHFIYVNFARPHKALANLYPRTPAMAAGLADHIWTCEDIAAVLD